MNYGSVAGVDKRISRIVQGTVMLSEADLDGAFTLLDGVRDAGCSAFDTAHVYGGGSAERVLGQWMEARGIRDECVVVGKGAHHNRDRRRVTAADIEVDLADSLARLRSDYIDVYLLHRDDESVPVDRIVDALAGHLQAGRINAYGGSNWSPARIDAANAYAVANGLPVFAASSPNLSLAVQAKPPWPECVSISGPAGRAACDAYQQSGMALFTWSSLAGGFFSGRFTPDNLDSFSAPLDRLCAEVYGTSENFERLKRATELGRDRDASPARVALAWLLSSGLNVFPLVGSQTAAEYNDNAAALELELSDTERAWLELETDQRP